MKRYGVRLSVRLSVPVWSHKGKPAAVGLLLWTGGQEITIDCCSNHGRMRVVPRCQRTQVGELVIRGCIA